MSNIFIYENIYTLKYVEIVAYDEWHVFEFCMNLLLQILFGPTASIISSHHHFSLTLWASPPLASLSVCIRATGLHVLIMVATLAEFVLVLAAPASNARLLRGKSLVLWIIFGDANYRGINVIVILEEIFRRCFLALFLCYMGMLCRVACGRWTNILPQSATMIISPFALGSSSWVWGFTVN